MSSRQLGDDFARRCMADPLPVRSQTLVRFMCRCGDLSIPREMGTSKKVKVKVEHLL